MTPTLFFQQLLNALALGGVYSLVALGLTLVYGVMKIPNFAHGALYMLGAYISYAGLTALGLPYILALGLSGLSLGVIAALLERVVFYPLRHAPHVQSMIAAIGVLFFIEAVIRLPFVFGSDFLQLPSPLTGILNFAGVTITAQRLLIIVVSLAIMAALYYFLKRTLTGTTIEAMAQNREGARLMGINVNGVAMLTFAISGALAAVASTLYAPTALISPSMGEVMNLKVFAIIILGGMGSVPGAVVGAFLLALAEVFGGVIVGADFADVVGFAVLVVVLAIRPQGLFRSGA